MPVHRTIATLVLALGLAASAAFAQSSSVENQVAAPADVAQSAPATSPEAVPDTPPETDVEKGTVRIFTIPGDAMLYADDRRVGSSPATPDETFKIRLSVGEHRIKAVKAGFGFAEKTVFVGADTDQKTQISLTPELAMVALPGGCFMMGSPPEEPERDADEGPQHQVCLQPFEIGKYEVTFEDWDACVADRGCPHRPDDQGWGRGNRPVINVSWEDAKTYIGWLNARTGKGFRLPSEAEWEYAARAGTTTPFSTGDCIHTSQANYDGTFEYSNCRNQSDVDLGHTMPVGSYAPNPWGLYDMHGNVSELTDDCWNSGYDGAPTDGSPWLEGNCARRVMRSGSWYGYSGYVRSAYRCRAGPTFRHRSIGMRLARSLSHE